MRLIDADAFEREVMMMPDEELCEDCCYNVLAKLDDAPTVSGWVSVKDRMPDTQNPVIVYVPPHSDECKVTFLGYVGMAYYTSLGEGFWCGTDGNLYGAIGRIYPPTHWMPLQEPPEVNENG